MGYYYVRHLSWKKSAPHWKLQFVSYKKSDLGESGNTVPEKIKGDIANLESFEKKLPFFLFGIYRTRRASVTALRKNMRIA